METPHKKPQTLSILVFVSPVLIVIAGVYTQSRSPQINQSLTCYLEKNNCVFGEESIDLSIVFRQKPVIEEELFVEILHASEQKISRAWIEGINMYMGKIPVMFDDPIMKQQDTVNGNGELGVFFLGSCTESKMQWVLYVETTQKNTELPKRYSVFFDTQI